MYLKFYLPYLLFSFIWFCCLSQSNSDLVKGVLLGALIARQKSGEKIIVIPNGSPASDGNQEEEYETTTEASTTTTTNPYTNIKSKNAQLMESMRQMAQMIQQILGQNSQKNPTTTQRPRQNSWSYRQQTSHSNNQKNPKGSQIMMMLPVMSMKSLDPIDSQSMTMMGSDNIEQFGEYDDYEEPIPKTSPNPWRAQIKGRKLNLT